MKCGLLKSVKLFFARGNSSGIRSRCKRCDTARSSLWRAKNRERYRLYAKNQRKRNRDKETVKVREKYRNDSEYRKKVRARGMVNSHIRRGKLVRGSCEKCGSEKAHAHHHDYSRPLDVRWLCRKCHAVEHGVKLICV